MKATQTQTQAQQSRMNLTAITSGVIDQPQRLILYGPPGIGKSTFGSNAPKPIFLGAEKGTANLDVARFPQPRIWHEVFEAVTTLATEDHSFETFVVDTLDWVEPLIHSFVAEKEKKDDIDSIGYGRGYNIALDQWRKFLSYVERLCDKRQLHIIFLAHSQIKKFQNPEGDDFDRYEMKLHHKASGLLQEWAEDVLFCNYETQTYEDKGRVKGIDSGARYIYTTRRAAWDAKNRNSLPAQLPLGWEDYITAVQQGEPATAENILSGIERLLESADGDLSSRVRVAIDKADNNAVKLSQILNKLKATMENK